MTLLHLTNRRNLIFSRHVLSAFNALCSWAVVTDMCLCHQWCQEHRGCPWSVRCHQPCRAARVDTGGSCFLAPKPSSSHFAELTSTRRAQVGQSFLAQRCAAVLEHAGTSLATPVPPVRGHHRRLTPVCGVSVAAPAARKRGGGCAIVTEGAPAAAKFTAVSRRRTRRGRKVAHTAATGAGAGAGAGVGSVDSAGSGDSSDEDMPAEGGATAADEEPYNDRIHGESGAATFIPLGLAAGDEYYSSGSDS